MKGVLGRETPVVNLAKGIEMGTLLRMTQVLEEVLGNRSRLAALSGPNHAEEVLKRRPVGCAIAAYDASVGTVPSGYVHVSIVSCVHQPGRCGGGAWRRFKKRDRCCSGE